MQWQIFNFTHWFLPHNAYRSGGETAQRFWRPAPSGANCRFLLLPRPLDARGWIVAEAHAEATAGNGHQGTPG